MEEFQVNYEQCESQECRASVRESYYLASELGNEKILEFYNSGELLLEEFTDLISFYKAAMMKGADELSISINDPADISTREWVKGLGNPIINGIYQAGLLEKMVAEGATIDQIETEILRNEILSSALSVPSHTEILQAVEEGSIAKLVIGAIVGKAVSPSGKGGGKGSAIPHKDPVVSSNGLSYKSNPKHTLGEQGNRPNAGIEPKNSLDLFGDSVFPKIGNQKARFTMDKNGDIHQFMPDGTGNYHWAGSTADKRNPLKITNKTKAALRKQFDWKVK